MSAAVTLPVEDETLRERLRVLLFARVVTGRSLGTLIPLSVVAAAEAFNEIMDRIFFGSWRWPDTTSDIVNTLFWPTVICLAVRLRPLVVAKKRRDRC